MLQAAPRTGVSEGKVRADGHWPTTNGPAGFVVQTATGARRRNDRPRPTQEAPAPGAGAHLSFMRAFRRLDHGALQGKSGQLSGGPCRESGRACRPGFALHALGGCRNIPRRRFGAIFRSRTCARRRSLIAGTPPPQPAVWRTPAPVAEFRRGSGTKEDIQRIFPAHRGHDATRAMPFELLGVGTD